MKEKTNILTITARIDGDLKICYLTRERSGLKIIAGCREIRAIFKSIDPDLITEEGSLFDYEGIRFCIHMAKILESGEIVTYMDKLCSVSPNMLSLFHDAVIVANDRDSVLLQGETGCGKELLARAIGNRDRDGASSVPFVPVNCAAIPSELIEAELFGYAKGAFTGAYERREGAFHSANGGTIFLDEIAELPFHLQPKLLRVLDSGEIRRVGEIKQTQVSVKVISATNKNLFHQVMKGEFRSDLFHRLACIILILPPLRERKEDIPILSQEILSELDNGHGYKLTEDAVASLIKYDFPGNVRELKNCLKRAIFKCQGKLIQPKNLDFQSYTEYYNPTFSFAENTFNIYNKPEILMELFCNRKNLSKSLKMFGIPRSTFYKNYYPLLKQMSGILQRFDH